MSCESEWARMNMGCRQVVDSEIPVALARMGREVKRLKGESRQMLTAPGPAPSPLMGEGYAALSRSD